MEGVYFWRESDPELGWLSQWYYCPFRDDEHPEIIYPTAEHYMMYQKAILFDDNDVGKQILAANHPRKVKALGRKVKGFSDKKWESNRGMIVRKGNILKFTNAVTEEGFRKGTTKDAPPIEGSLKEMLLATGTRELVEASPLDRIWGVGYSPTNAPANRATWGKNLLGKALMEVREALRQP
ncbi:protein T24A6.7 [Cordyceps javanica]|uniref:Protein T24A6.7 n=1 Tax=Cordyceps javanica TaxID=43265 RepID=A0A545VSC7_9HYPO|nr:protein T24A6.7 [Cordyceps javanica]TQW04631.1 protein T24A6.7 [Cordyceps javanica]